MGQIAYHLAHHAIVHRAYVASIKPAAHYDAAADQAKAAWAAVVTGREQVKAAWAANKIASNASRATWLGGAANVLVALTAFVVTGWQIKAARLERVVDRYVRQFTAAEQAIFAYWEVDALLKFLRQQDGAGRAAETSEWTAWARALQKTMYAYTTHAEMAPSFIQLFMSVAVIMDDILPRTQDIERTRKTTRQALAVQRELIAFIESTAPTRRRFLKFGYRLCRSMAKTSAGNAAEQLRRDNRIAKGGPFFYEDPDRCKREQKEWAIPNFTPFPTVAADGIMASDVDPDEADDAGDIPLSYD